MKFIDEVLIPTPQAQFLGQDQAGPGSAPAGGGGGPGYNRGGGSAGPQIYVDPMPPGT